jgi:hypothetical protein
LAAALRPTLQLTVADDIVRAQTSTARRAAGLHFCEESVTSVVRPGMGQVTQPRPVPVVGKIADVQAFDEGSAMSACAFDVSENAGFHDGLLPQAKNCSSIIRSPLTSLRTTRLGHNMRARVPRRAVVSQCWRMHRE